MSRVESESLDILELIDDCQWLGAAAPVVLRIPEPRTATTLQISEDCVLLLEGYAEYGG
ncbi:MAG: hypothetical protein NVSMB13_06040 [Mycobacteriales bacterium]